MSAFDIACLRLYFIAGSQNGSSPKAVLEVLERALDEGITAFQWREKGKGSLEGSAKLNFGREAEFLCKKYGVPFIVNDDLDMALRLKADGLHLGQDDGNYERALGKVGILGVSAHDFSEIKAALKASYIGIGPVYPTKSKKDAKEALGLDFLREVRRKYPLLPFVAIGGLDQDKALACMRMGASGVAVISAIFEDEDFIKNFLKGLEK